MPHPSATARWSLAPLVALELSTTPDAIAAYLGALRAELPLLIVEPGKLGPHTQLARTWRPDLHLALWNPYQALDIDAPALMTYGFAAPALDAVNAWLEGTLEAAGRCPVPGFA